MLKLLTLQAQQGIRLMVYLANHPRQRFSTKRLADELDSPFHTLSKVVQSLTRAGLLEGFPGRKGGVTLTKPLGKTSILEIAEAVDGPLSENCLLDACLKKDGDCPMCRISKKFSRQVSEDLGSKTLQSVAQACR